MGDQNIDTGYFEKNDKINEILNVFRIPNEPELSFYKILQINPDMHYGSLIGESIQMHKVYETISRLNNSLNVLIKGESGTGKELVAKAIHNSGPRQHQPFVKINCASLQSTLLEGELFGYEKGAFTGADRKKTGRMEFADGGTVFLDEVNSADAVIQAKLLRVIEHREFERLGSNKTIKVNIRILAATNQELEDLIVQGKFRLDLYYRLNTLPIVLAPLRMRTGDINLLLSHFIKKYNAILSRNVAGFTNGFLSRCNEYHWPGNVRELENVVCRSMLETENSFLESSDFPFVAQAVFQKRSYNEFMSEIVLKLKESGEHGAIYQRVIDDTEKNLLKHALNETDWNIKRTSEFLGIARNTLKDRMVKFGLK